MLSKDDSTHSDLAEIENLSTSAKRIYSSSTFPSYPTLGEALSADDAKLLGLHSIYHLCQMVLLCPLISLFSGRRLDPEFDSGTSNESVRTHAEIVTKHAVLHGQLIRHYIYRGCDVTKLTPLVGYASFVAASILVALVKSETRRHRDRCDGIMQASDQLLDLIKDTLDLLSVLQVFWEPLESMVSA